MLNYFKVAIVCSVISMYQANELLIVIDYQKDFLIGGNMAKTKDSSLISQFKEEEDAVTESLKTFITSFSEKQIIIVKDLHPEDHISFLGTHLKENSGDKEITNYLSTEEHPGVQIIYDKSSVNNEEISKNTYEVKRKIYNKMDDVSSDEVSIIQALFPDHCINGTVGAELEDSVNAVINEIEEKKLENVHYINLGMHKNVDELSIIKNNAGSVNKNILETIVSMNIKKIYLVGNFLEFTVINSAIDLSEYLNNTEIFIVNDLTISYGDKEMAIQNINSLGQNIKIINSKDYSRNRILI